MKKKSPPNVIAIAPRLLARAKSLPKMREPAAAKWPDAAEARVDTLTAEIQEELAEADNAVAAVVDLHGWLRRAARDEEAGEDADVGELVREPRRVAHLLWWLDRVPKCEARTAIEDLVLDALSASRPAKQPPALTEAIAFAEKHGHTRGITDAVMRATIARYATGPTPRNGMEWIAAFDFEARLRERE